MSLRMITAATLLAITFTTPLAAQEMDHSKMNHGAMTMDGMAQPKGDTGPSSTAFAEANAKMHGGMDIVFTGNADVDFVRGMIAHHQGAIDMAKIELQYGKDAELRKLAEGVISAQEAEIKTMTEWLANNGG
ncbi:CopM family metallochaperone [Rhizobium sp. LjRoot98]|uniref:CopM family metallochaperone n=1 Tax=Rhizobium sp. LjRoot98 TaxID=3342345 RepID=UPI003F50B142